MKKKTEKELLALLKQDAFNYVLNPYIKEYELPTRVLEELFSILYKGYKIPDEKDERKWRGFAFEALSTLIFYKNQRSFPEKIKVWLQQRIEGDSLLQQDCKVFL